MNTFNPKTDTRMGYWSYSVLSELEMCWATMPNHTFGEFLHVVESYMEQRKIAERFSNVTDEGLVEVLREIRMMDEE